MNFESVLNSTYTLALLALLVLSFISLCLYYGLIWLRVGCCKKDVVTRKTGGGASHPSVSVVMVVHNEAEYLKKSLPYLLEQDYPDFEVVVVDYTSTDDTHFVLRVCSENYPQLKPITIKHDVNMFQGRKYPLSIGIKSAKKEVILLTDAESTPRTFDWIRRMVEGYRGGAEIVEGYNLVKSNGKLLGAFQQYENMVYNASYLGAAMMGKPYTASGRNLSYRRDFFFKSGGFISHYSIPDGDDDLFVNQNANSRNTSLVLNSDAVVESEARSTFHQWHLDRSHRLYTRRYYGLKDKLMLSIYPLSQIVFLAALVLLFVGQIFPWEILLGVLLLKIIWQIVCLIPIAKKFEIKRIHFFAPFFEFYFLFANTFLTCFALRSKNKQWR